MLKMAPATMKDPAASPLVRRRRGPRRCSLGSVRLLALPPSPHDSPQRDPGHSWLATRSPPPCRVPVRTVDRVQVMSRTDAVEHLRERTPESWAGRSSDRLDRPLRSIRRSARVVPRARSYVRSTDHTLMRVSPGVQSEGSYRRQRARVRRHIGVSHGNSRARRRRVATHVAPDAY